MLYEFFGRKDPVEVQPTELEKIYAQPAPIDFMNTINKYNNFRRETNNYLKIIKTYKNLNNFTNEIIEKYNYYYGKMIINFKNSCAELYRLSKNYKNLPQEFDFVGEFEKLSNFYTNRTSNGRDGIMSEMISATYFLNRIYDNVTDSKFEEDNFYFIMDEEIRQYKFKSRIKDQEAFDEHKGEDPFGEENWK